MLSGAAGDKSWDIQCANELFLLSVGLVARSRIREPVLCLSLSCFYFKQKIVAVRRSILAILLKYQWPRLCGGFQ